MKNIIIFLITTFFFCSCQQEMKKHKEEKTFKVEVKEKKAIESNFKEALDSLMLLQYQYKVVDFEENPIDDSRLVGFVKSGIEKGIHLDSLPIEGVKK